MKKTATVNLSKYNVPIKQRSKITTAPATGYKTEALASSTIDGRVIVTRRAATSDVVEVAREVIVKHNDVIKRLAKR